MNYIHYVLLQDPEHTFTADEMAGVISENQLSYFEPGTGYHYSDTGYSLLFKIIERVSGESYSDFVTRNILEMNKLESSLLPYLGTDQTMPEPFVPGYLYDQGQSEPFEAENMSYQIGNGNLVGTLHDLSTFAKLLFTGRAGLDMKYVEMMMDTVQIDDAKGYGLGCEHVYGLGYGHSGAIHGYLSGMYYDPDNDLSIAIISNVWNLNDLVNQAHFQREVAFEVRKVLEPV